MSSPFEPISIPLTAFNWIGAIPLRFRKGVEGDKNDDGSIKEKCLALPDGLT
jgi:hypothetical protein